MMAQRWRSRLSQFVPSLTSIRWRLFWLLGGLGLSMLFAVQLVWLPGTMQDIREAQSTLQHVIVHRVRDQIFDFLEEREGHLRAYAKIFRPSFVQHDQAALRLLARRFLEVEHPFVEIGLLDAQGQERLKVSRVLTVTDQDLVDLSTSALFQEVLQHKIYWGPIVTTETSEPWMTLALALEGSDASFAGVIYGVIDLKALWELTGDLQLSHGGRVYVVDRSGQLIAADDANLVLKQLSFAHRPLVQRLLQPPLPREMEFVHGDYANEYGVRVTATGLSLAKTQWGIVVEQPQAILRAPMVQKIWFTLGFSVIGILLSLGVAHAVSQRFTRSIIQLREGVIQLGSGHLTHQVAVDTRDEIGDLAHEFNRMAERLRASHDELERHGAAQASDLAVLYALTNPLSQTSTLQHVLDDAMDRIMQVMGAQAGIIALCEEDKGDLCLSASRGFSKAGVEAFGQLWRDGVTGDALRQTGASVIVEANLDEARGPLGWLRCEGFHSALYLLLQTPEKLLGMLSLACREHGPCRQPPRDLLLAIAHQLVVSIENARLHGAVVRRNTELDALLQALEASVEYNSLIIETAHDAFVAADQDGVITAWNRQAEVLFGWSRQEAIGRTLAETILPPQYRQAYMEEYRSLANNTASAEVAQPHLERTMRHRSGRELLVELTHWATRVDGMFRNHAFFHDISERKQAEQMKSDFVSFVTHQLRTPLSGIKWLLELATSEEEPLEERQAYIQDAQVSANRLIDLVNDLLDVSRLERGKMKCVPQAVQLTEVTQDVLAECASLIQAKHQRLVFDAPAPVAPVWVDAQLIRQVILNLLSNASKFTPDGGEITVTIRQEADTVRWLVHDTGIGIPAEAQGHIFEKFYRADNAYRTETEGTGLGLYIVRLIVEQGGGRIGFTSEENKGTTFVLTLPHPESSRARPAPTGEP